jgi:hypothetical protein
MSNRIVFELHQLNNFSKEERDKFIEAIRLAEDVLNSIEFKNRFLNLPLVQTNGNTNKQVYNQLMSGADKFNKELDNDIDVYITLYYSFKNTVGYTYPTTWFTWINRKFFSSFDYADVAGNVVHEYMHNVGYDHIRASDKWSVPYAIGYLVRDMIKEKIKYDRYLTQYEITTGEIVDLNDGNNDNTPQVVYTQSLWSRIKSILFNIFR